ncbi:MAG: hypothetical protein SGJ19_25145 [Planctomycetia bacterium]|nr:hypothetical protein [Planctomycetia bacterium]
MGCVKGLVQHTFGLWQVRGASVCSNPGRHTLQHVEQEVSGRNQPGCADEPQTWGAIA